MAQLSFHQILLDRHVNGPFYEHDTCHQKLRPDNLKNMHLVVMISSLTFYHTQVHMKQVW